MALPFITPALLDDVAQRRAAITGLPLPTMGALPSMASASPIPLPTPAMRDVAPSQAIANTNELTRLNATGSGVIQIHNPLLRGLARTGDIALQTVGSVLPVFHALDALTPGTTLHHNALVNQQQKLVADDQAQANQAAQTAGQLASNRLATDKANAIENPAPVAPEYDYVDGPNGKVAILKGTTTAAPVTINGKPLTAAPKPVTNAFELWHQQNPNGTVDDFNKLESKPLSAAEAASLNSIFDGLAGKHNLPQGQFKEGMAHADALQIQSALNQAVGKQQGDTHVSISMAGLSNQQANQQARNAPLDTNDPANQAAVQAVANGSMKLSDVFGRGATTAQKAQFAAAVKAINPAFNSGDHDIENGARRYMISGGGGQTLNAINTAYHHLDQFDAVARALKNGDFKAINRIANEYGVQYQPGASPQVVGDLVKNALKGEVAKAFTGAGATVDEQRNLDSSFGNANSLDTMLGVSKQARALLRGKETSLQGQYTQGQQGRANFSVLQGEGSTPQQVDGHYDPVTKKVVYH